MFGTKTPLLALLNLFLTLVDPFLALFYLFLTFFNATTLFFALVGEFFRGSKWQTYHKGGGGIPPTPKKKI